MINGIALGQYFPGQSVMHKMDPRIKLINTFIFIIAVFIPQSWAGLLMVILFVLFSINCSKIPGKTILKSFKPIIPIILITSLINVFYTQSGTILWKWWIFTISTGGLNKAGFMAVRILCLIVGSSLMTYTTTPTALTDGMERVFSPLKVFHVHVHELAMMMTIALRFIPTLIEETDKIMSAQKARGADMESGGLSQRIKAFIPVLIPLFVSSFRRAYELATAMECRCYHGGEGRTRMKQLKMQGRDYSAIAVMTVFVGLLIASLFVVPPVL
ncbi:MAG: energy-coupling factor transporter transmembrane protein EcfT [Clostridia bacterium]|nr:energy-coupling factor transporter transmembrane protein EcfT [Clostridia bacterium]